MAIYESMVIFSGRMEAQEVDAEIEKVRRQIETGEGSLHSVERMGKRRLSYEIRKEMDGHYTVLHFVQEPDRIAPLQRAFRLNEAILRHIVFRKEKLPEGPPTAGEGARAAESDTPAAKVETPAAPETAAAPTPEEAPVTETPAGGEEAAPDPPAEAETKEKRDESPGAEPA